uniref:G-protein coupled receptors family 3 profile domain-containing protein n=1 Tax=Vannella robusta TaxID=1487602 RepID=A0A7S4MMH0_9EUKA
MRVQLFLIVCLVSCVVGSPKNVTLTTMNVLPSLPETPLLFRALETVIELARITVNEDPSILPFSELLVSPVYHFGSAGLAITEMMKLSENDVSLVGGNFFADVSTFTATVGGVFDIAQLSASASSPILADDLSYPLFSRLAPSSAGQGAVIRETILYYGKMQTFGWDKVAVISTSSVYGISLSNEFIANIGEEIEISTYQQFVFEGELTGALTSIEVELEEIKNSGARIIVAFIIGNYENLIVEADQKGLVGENYVWFVSDAISGTFFTNETVIELSRGLLGTFQYIPQDTPQYAGFIDLWNSADPEIFHDAGTVLSPFYFLTYDYVLTAAKAFDEADKLGLLDSGERVSGAVWTDMIREMQFNGTSGPVAFDSIGDRIAPFSISYYVPETGQYELAAIYDETTGFELLKDIVWFSNTTEIPDLDIRDPFHYWSCHDGKKKYDPTGKSVHLHTPDGSNIDDIDFDYHCDHFIDCENMSDEHEDCSADFVTLFIVFGVVTGVLVLIAIFLMFFVIIFGLFLEYRRLRVASPAFLVLLLISIIVGYCSVYAWFGKPHPVACGFQPWLLGLPAISMISALCAKSFRIWRIFKKASLKQRISDLELLGLWALLMLPAVLIVTIWTIVSTPTAEMKDFDDEHYVCTTGGFTGEPGGYVFFSILVAYGALVLLFGIFLSIVTRNVPSMFNESKLLAISIYNLIFLSVVIIPVFLVVNPFNPFAAWILRTVAILYAFTATMVLQFGPPLFGIIVKDKCKNVRVFKTSLTMQQAPKTSSLTTSD